MPQRRSCSRRLVSRILVRAALWLLVLLAPAAAAVAACLPMAGAPEGPVPAGNLLAGRSALLRPAALAAGGVELTFLGHSSFLIRSPDGVTAITDYNGYVRGPLVPTIVTMNNAHDTHFTEIVEPGVRHVLRGWGDAEGPARHDLREGDLRIWNVPTNVRDWGGTRYAGNSIFVFEVAELCIAHLGHLHHPLTEEHLGLLGAIDVVLAPVDGAYTMAQPLMAEAIEAIRPSLVIPMHYFGTATLARFLDLMRERWDIRTSDMPTVVLSRATLPHRQVLVLPGI